MPSACKPCPRARRSLQSHLPRSAASCYPSLRRPRWHCDLGRRPAPAAASRGTSAAAAATTAAAAAAARRSARPPRLAKSRGGRARARTKAAASERATRRGRSPGRRASAEPPTATAPSVPPQMPSPSPSLAAAAPGPDSAATFARREAAHPSNGAASRSSRSHKARPRCCRASVQRSAANRQSPRPSYEGTGTFYRTKAARAPSGHRRRTLRARRGRCLGPARSQTLHPSASPASAGPSPRTTTSRRPSQWHARRRKPDGR
mmetsp:Transcript_173978/g.557759  ORF Transcript_173978/g.557759 Transcript_173978/m.557759 type:complete len:262 (+) Transcript_173978:949-1734(+)